MEQRSGRAKTPSSPAAWAAFRAGLRCALRHWPLVFLFYIVLLLFSTLLLWPLAQAMTNRFGYNLAAGEIAEGLPAWLVGESLMNLLQDPGAARPAGSGLLLLSLPAWPFFLAMPFTVLGAGAIALYAGDTPRTDWRRMGAGLARFALPFLLLLLLEVSLYELALLFTILLAVLVVVVSGSMWSVLSVVPVLALVIAVLPWWFEYARVLAVVEGQGNVFRALGRAWTFLLRHLGPAALLALCHFLLLLVPPALFSLPSRLLPASWWVGHTLLQQASIAALLAARLIRTAGQVSLVTRISTRPGAPATDRPLPDGQVGRIGG